MKIWTTTVFFLMSICVGFSCASGHLAEPRDTSSVEGGSRVLIAIRRSEFKAEVVSRLIAGYQHRANIKTIELDEIEDVQTADYDALIVMGARMGWLMFSGRELLFLRRLQRPEKLIMVMTAANSEWEWDRDDIDVITCASKRENVEPLYREVSERLDALIE